MFPFPVQAIRPFVIPLSAWKFARYQDRFGQQGLWLGLHPAAIPNTGLLG